EDTPDPGQERLQPHSHDGEPPRPAPVSRLSAAAGSYRKSQADGPISLSGRIPAGGGTRSKILSPGQHPPTRAPRQGSPPSSPAPAAAADHLHRKDSHPNR